MRNLLVIAAACAVAACAVTQTLEPVEAPPVRFQQSRPVLVEFVEPENVTARCLMRGGVLAATCANREMITIGNPCRYDGWYAKALCHELAHANGWPPDHKRD